MLWNECNPMDERLRFTARLLEGEKMAPLCRQFGISRVTGYKIYNRYKDSGLDGLNDRGRAPYRQANKLPFQIERTRHSAAPIPFICIHLHPGSMSHPASLTTRITTKSGWSASWSMIWDTSRKIGTGFYPVPHHSCRTKC